MDKRSYLEFGNMRIVRPVDESSIPGFVAWINHNPFKGMYIHGGLDFAAYLKKEGENVIPILGLPQKTLILAIADGGVAEIIYPNSYYTQIRLEHYESGDGFRSWYTHVLPLVEKSQEVVIGQPIAYLYHQKKEGKKIEQLIHLHFSILEGLFGIDYLDPADIIFKNEPLLPWEAYRDKAVFAQKDLDEKLRYYPETSLTFF